MKKIVHNKPESIDNAAYAIRQFQEDHSVVDDKLMIYYDPSNDASLKLAHLFGMFALLGKPDWLELIGDLGYTKFEEKKKSVQSQSDDDFQFIEEV